MHHFFFAFGEKKSNFFSRLRRDVWHPGGGEGLYNPPTATHPYTAAMIILPHIASQSHTLIFRGVGFFGKRGGIGPAMVQKWSKMAKIAPKSAK